MSKSRLTVLIFSLSLFFGHAAPTFAQGYPVPMGTFTPTPFGTATPTSSPTPTLAGWDGNGFAGCGGGHGQLPVAAQEQLLLNAINETRTSDGLLPLMIDDGLTNMGQYLAIDMVDEAYAAEATTTGEFIIHDRINGDLVSVCPVTNLWSRPLWGLYTHYNFDYLPPIVGAESVEDVLVELDGSPLLSDAAVQRLGVGYEVAADGTPHWMLVFARDYLTPTPTPTTSNVVCVVDNGFTFSVEPMDLAVGDTFEVIFPFDEGIESWELIDSPNDALLAQGGDGLETIQYETEYVFPVGDNRYEVVQEGIINLEMHGRGIERFAYFDAESNQCVQSSREVPGMFSNKIVLTLGMPTSVFSVQERPDIPAGLFIFASLTTALVFASMLMIRRS